MRALGGEPLFPFVLRRGVFPTLGSISTACRWPVPCEFRTTSLGAFAKSARKRNPATFIEIAAKVFERPLVGRASRPKRILKL